MKPKKIRNSFVLAELSGYAPKPRKFSNHGKRTKQKERRELDAELV